MISSENLACTHMGPWLGEIACRICWHNAQAEIERLVEALEVAREQARLGYVLSTYAASIHWDRSKNTPEWMAGLRERIELVQAAAKASEEKR